jgi:hypothetical protein
MPTDSGVVVIVSESAPVFVLHELISTTIPIPNKSAFRFFFISKMCLVSSQTKIGALFPAFF